MTNIDQIDEEENPFTTKLTQIEYIMDRNKRLIKEIITKLNIPTEDNLNNENNQEMIQKYLDDTGEKFLYIDPIIGCQQDDGPSKACYHNNGKHDCAQEKMEMIKIIWVLKQVGLQNKNLNVPRRLIKEMLVGKYYQCTTYQARVQYEKADFTNNVSRNTIQQIEEEREALESERRSVLDNIQTIVDYKEGKIEDWFIDQTMDETDIRRRIHTLKKENTESYRNIKGHKANLHQLQKGLEETHEIFLKKRKEFNKCKRNILAIVNTNYYIQNDHPAPLDECQWNDILPFKTVNGMVVKRGYEQTAKTAMEEVLAMEPIQKKQKN